MPYYNLVGLLILILDIYVIFLIWSRPGDLGMKLLWTIIVLLLPLLGAVLYLLLAGRKTV